MTDIADLSQVLPTTSQADQIFFITVPHSKISPAAVFLMDVDEEHEKSLKNRAQWYEAKWIALDQPEWNPATFVSSTEVAPKTKMVTLKIEISRERVAILNAYKRIGQLASIRVNNGVEYKIPPANAPFPEELNKQALYNARGDISAYEVKEVTELTSVKADLDLLVTEETCPDLYLMQEDAPVEVGPFTGVGLDIRGPPMAIFQFPTVVIFVEGEGIATARALVEATPDIPGLCLPLREQVRMYYKAPNEDSFIFKERFETWAELGCEVRTTTESFQDAFDEDETLVYSPETTMAVILTGKDEESEKPALAVCKEAEITTIVRESVEGTPTNYFKTGAKQV